MAKSRDAFRTISEVSATLDTPTHVLRFWESKFTQIKPVKRAGGRRYYRPDDISLLSGIKTLLHEQGMTIKGAQKLLREKGVKHVMTLDQSVSPLADNQVNIDQEAIETKQLSEGTLPVVSEVAAPDETVDPATTGPGSAALDVDPLTPIETASPIAPSPREIDIQTTLEPAIARVSILAALTRQNSDRLQTIRSQIAPLAAKLEVVRDRMRAS